MPSLVSCVLASGQQLPACQSGQRLILYHFVSILLFPPLRSPLFHSLQLLSLDNDGSAFCKCKIYFAMYKLNVRHINNFVLRWACTNASTMHCRLPGTHSHIHRHFHSLTHTHTHWQLATAIKLRPSSLLCITF